MYYAIMPKYNIPRNPLVKVTVDKINAFLEARGITRTQAAIDSRVSQPQVSKILNGLTKKPNDGLYKLCDYAEIKYPPELSEVHMDPRITKAISKVWDGRDETIELIVRMIECAAHVNNIPRRQVNEQEVT